jgi:hypothetical protein
MAIRISVEDHDLYGPVVTTSKVSATKFSPTVLSRRWDVDGALRGDRHPRLSPQVHRRQAIRPCILPLTGGRL